MQTRAFQLPSTLRVTFLAASLAACAADARQSEPTDRDDAELAAIGDDAPAPDCDPEADAGPGPGSDAGTNPGSDAGTDPGTPAHLPRCMNKPTQLMVIGDSYINWLSHTLPKDLERESGQKGWRMEAIGAASMGSGGVTREVPKQFDVSLARDPDVHTVLMDGGGNDVLVPDFTLDPFSSCKNNQMSPSLAACQKIVQKALDAGNGLLERAAKAGVRDAVFFFYPRVPEGTLVGGAHPNAINDYARPKVKALCDEAEGRTGGKLRCHFVDMVPVFEGHPEFFAEADIHPNPTGSAAMAKAIWKTMKDNCVGQLPNSGCCEP